MKITTNIDGTLLKKAIRETGLKSQRIVLESGLRNLLADVHRKRFVREFDEFRVDFSLKDLKLRRA